MPVNLEIKVELKSHKNVKTILKSIGAEFIGILKQKDIYFKGKSQLLKLRIQGNRYEFIRYNRDESGKTRWSKYVIIDMQGKMIPEFLQSILTVETVIEKRRELWYFDNTRIHLDTVKGLGQFLELETLVLKKGRKDAENRFNYMVNTLDLDVKGQIRSSYRTLMLKISKKK
ncbi:MAG: CYTH domain-containing protein [Clostridiales bacterium]